MLNEDIRQWALRMSADLQNRAPPVIGGVIPGDETASIFRVPVPLREVSEQSYDPKLLSFGLYHVSAARTVGEALTDSVVDTFRQKFVRVFMNITGKEWDAICSEVVGDSVEDWVKLYDDFIFERQDEDVIKVLLTLDAIFVVCFLQADHQRRCKSCRMNFPTLNPMRYEIEKGRVAPLVHLIRLDIFKFENQIPLGLIEKVSRMMMQGSIGTVDQDPLNYFVVNAVCSMYCDLPGSGDRREFMRTVKTMDFKNGKHLLGCLYSVVCYKSISSQTGNLDMAQPETENVAAEPGLMETLPPLQSVDSVSMEIRGRDQPRPGIEIVFPVHSVTTSIDVETDNGRGGVSLARICLSCITICYQGIICFWNLITLCLTSIFKGSRKWKHQHYALVPAIVTLQRARIKVTILGKWISDVKFETSFFGGILYLPALVLYDETEDLLRNLLVYEYVVEKKQDLMSYVRLMDSLIGTIDDVKVMKEIGLLKNYSVCNDERIASMWTSMLTGTVSTLSSHYQREVFDKIMNHYNSGWNKFVVESQRNPLFTGGVLLLLINNGVAIASLVYTVLSYYGTQGGSTS